jgi:hypothetical protein
VNGLLPWERLLWSSRPLRLHARQYGEYYFLNDFRLVRRSRLCADEIALDEIGEVGRTESALDRMCGTSTVVVHARNGDRPPLVVADIRRGAQLAAILELLATDPRALSDTTSIRAALAWEPQVPAAYREAIGAFAAVIVAIAAVVVGLHGRPIVTTYAADDAIRPGGVKRSRTEIASFMERDVMPWARATLARLKGGPDRITCETCHGDDAEARDWAMPAVAALPEPDLRERGWETYSGRMDAQMRNAIYGYVTESEKSAKAAYMREVVLPGMAALLHRPAYDFTRSYEQNRARNALGCYHCHRVQ